MSSPSSAREIGLLVADVDGTLVRPDKVLTRSAIAAVQHLRDTGISFTIVSSRPPRGMAPIVERLDIGLPFAAFNGGSLVGPDLVLLEAHRLSSEAARATLSILADHAVDAWVYADGDWRLRNPDAPRVGLERRALGFGPVRVDGFDDVIDRIDKIVGVSDDHPRFARMEAEARRRLKGTAAIQRSQPYYLDVTNPKANKGEAVAGLCRRIRIDPGRTAVIGDMFNDVAMFAIAGFSIAMGQAPDDVKRCADAVTRSNAEEGFAHAVEHLVLPRAARRGA